MTPSKEPHICEVHATFVRDFIVVCTVFLTFLGSVLWYSFHSSSEAFAADKEVSKEINLNKEQNLKEHAELIERIEKSSRTIERQLDTLLVIMRDLKGNYNK